jgi:8-oxo-dGTP diphosphatase
MERRSRITGRSRGATAQAPEAYDPHDFPPFAVTVDIVVLTIVGEILQVLLVERGGDPYRGSWALPGGFKRPDETLDEAAMRELREETGLDAAGRLVQLGAYGDPGRDPRMDVVTVVYRAVLPTVADLVSGTDASAASLWPAADVLSGLVPLAFDHARIVRDAIERTGVDLSATDLALSFVDERFTLSQLRSVFEAVWGAPLDPANFRRSLIGTDRSYVEPTGHMGRPGTEGGRPPELYRPVEAAWRRGAPLQRRETRSSSQANKKLFNQIRALRKAGRLQEALELVPPHWTSERTTILAAMDAARAEPHDEH